MSQEDFSMYIGVMLGLDNKKAVFERIRLAFLGVGDGDRTHDPQDHNLIL